MYAVPSCLVVMNRQAVSNKIVFVCLHFITYSHLICSTRGLMFLMKVENLRMFCLFYFCVLIVVLCIAFSNRKKSSVLANATVPTLNVV